MANPLPRLSSQPADILRLLGGQLGLSEHAALSQVSHSLAPVHSSLQKRRLELQKLQWGRLFPQQFGNNFEANEELLRELSLQTIPLTASEEAALRAAWRSLDFPPPNLTTEQEQSLARQHLESYAKYMAHDFVAEPMPEEDDVLGEIDYQEHSAVKAYHYRWDLLDRLFVHEEHQDAFEEEVIPTFDAQNLTQVALLDGSFEAVLRIFSQDGARYQRRVSMQPNAPLVNEQEPPTGEAYSQAEIDLLNLAVIRMTGHREPKSGSFGQIGLNEIYAKACMLLLIIAAGRPAPASSFCIKQKSTCSLPAVTQILSMTGYDFLRVTPLLPNSPIGMSYLGQCTLAGVRTTHVSTDTAMSLTIIIDRLLVQGQLSGECLERIKSFLDQLSAPKRRYDKDGSVQQYIREHLADREIVLPGEAIQ